MKLDDFQTSLTENAPPTHLSLPLQALWQDAKGNWDAAHKLVQSDEGEAKADWVHAYLHRKEGDLSNAGYWYRRAGKVTSQQTLTEEWQAIVQALLVAA